LWQRRFAGRTDIQGETLKVNGVARTIVGVMPAGFRFPEFAELWIPLTSAANDWKRDDRSLAVLARLRPGVEIGQARAEVKALAADLEARYPETNRRWTAAVVYLRQDMTGEKPQASAVLLSAVGFVLLIACANVANLLLVRASDRRREVAIRIALGASRLRIVRLLVVEGVTLAVAGGAFGWLLAVWASGALVASFGAEVPYWIQFGIDWHVYAFAVGVTLATGVLCGLAPAIQASRANPQPALKDGAAAVGSGGGRRFRAILASGQLALALVLLAGAGLLVKTVIRTFAVTLTYDPSRVLVGDIELADQRYADPGRIRHFADAILERMARIDGVRSGVSRQIFFAGFGGAPRRMEIEGSRGVPEGASPSFYYAVTPEYFKVIGLRLREGRAFTAADPADVVVVNEEMSRRVWTGASPIGQRIRFPDRDAGGRWLTVVGVAANEPANPFGERTYPSAYVPFGGAPGRSFAIYASGPGEASRLAPEIRAAVEEIDPDQPIEGLMTMEQLRAEWAAPARFVAMLMSALAAVALLMASMGTFGVIAYGVSQRTREIGVRLALGASPRQIQQLVVRGGAILTGAGLAFGLAGAWLSTRALEGILAGTSPTDPEVFGAVSLMLAAVALVATWIPARRAARVDPLRALRES
jgi:putative ABC transport system permease protein